MQGLVCLCRGAAAQEFRQRRQRQRGRQWQYSIRQLVTASTWLGILAFPKTRTFYRRPRHLRLMKQPSLNETKGQKWCGSWIQKAELYLAQAVAGPCHLQGCAAGLSQALACPPPAQNSASGWRPGGNPLHVCDHLNMFVASTCSLAKQQVAQTGWSLLMCLHGFAA